MGWPGNYRNVRWLAWSALVLVLDELDQAVRAHLDDPDTRVMPNLLFLARARKPAA
jgi:hypothetical protein